MIQISIEWKGEKADKDEEKMKREYNLEELRIMIRSVWKCRRIKAIKSLEKFGNEQAIYILIPALKDKSWKVRLNAVRSIRKISNDKFVNSTVINRLIECLNDWQRDVVEVAIEALIDIGDPAIEPLISALDQLSDSKREMGANRKGERISEVLGIIGDERAIEPLLKRLQDEHSYFLSINSLLYQQIPGSLKIVRVDKPEPWIVYYGEPASFLSKGAPLGLKLLSKKIGGKPILEALVKSNKEKHFVSLSAIWGDLAGDNEAYTYLLSLLNDEKVGIRENVIKTLGKIGDSRAVMPLIASLEDKECWVRREAAIVLGNMGSHQAIEPLITALNDKDIDVRLNADSALMQITGKDFGRKATEWQEWWHEKKEFTSLTHNTKAILESQKGFIESKAMFWEMIREKLNRIMLQLPWKKTDIAKLTRQQKEDRAWTLIRMGSVSELQGDLAEAISLYQQAERLFLDTNNLRGLSACYLYIGNNLQDLRTYNRAMKWYRRYLKIIGEGGNLIGRSRCYLNMGINLQNQGYYEKAMKHYQQSLGIMMELGDRAGMSDCYLNMGLLYDKCSDRMKALRMYRQSLSLKQALGLMIPDWLYKVIEELERVGGEQLKSPINEVEG